MIKSQVYCFFDSPCSEQVDAGLSEGVMTVLMATSRAHAEFYNERVKLQPTPNSTTTNCV